MPVTQNITFSATPPTTGENPTTFNYNAISCWDDLKNNIVPALNTAFGQLNDLETNVNAKEVSCVNSASSAASDALLAAGAANNKGAWSLLTGALNIPAAVNHSGSIWILNRNIANVALSMPTPTNTDWTESSGVTQQELDAVSAASVKTTTDQTIAGSKAFSSPIKLANSGFTATLQSGTLSGDVVHTLPKVSDTLAGISNVVGLKNYIINGNFGVWQRGTSFNIAAGESRCADMFLAYNVATNPTASIDNGPAGSFNSLKISGENSVSNKHIIHRIESINSISLGQDGNTKVTFSFLAKADVASTAKVAIRVPNTTDVWGAYTTAKTSSDIQITTGWARYSVTFDLDFTYWGGIAVDLYTTTAQTSLWTGRWQLEKGSVATPFENRPYGLELSLCQNYYEILGKAFFTGRATSNGDFYGGAVYFRTTKRISPTAIITSMNITGCTLGSVGAFINKDAISVYSTGGSGFTSGQAVIGDAIITLSAEL